MCDLDIDFANVYMARPLLFFLFFITLGIFLLIFLTFPLFSKAYVVHFFVRQQSDQALLKVKATSHVEKTNGSPMIFDMYVYEKGFGGFSDKSDGTINLHGRYIQ